MRELQRLRVRPWKMVRRSSYQTQLVWHRDRKVTQLFGVTTRVDAPDNQNGEFVVSPAL